MRKKRHDDEAILKKFRPDMPDSLRAHINEGWSPPLWAKRNNMTVEVFDDICQVVPEMSEIRKEYRSNRAGRKRFQRWV